MGSQTVYDDERRQVSVRRLSSIWAFADVSSSSSSKEQLIPPPFIVALPVEFKPPPVRTAEMQSNVDRCDLKLGHPRSRSILSKAMDMDERDRLGARTQVASPPGDGA